MPPSIVVPKRRLSLARLAVVTVGLIGGGAIAGGVAGALGAGLWVAIQEGVRGALSPQLWLIAGMIGAPIGAFVLPVAGFTLLRFVPLWRVLVTTILGTALGGAIGAQFLNGQWLGGALVGFAAAAVWLWSEAQKARRRSAPE